MEYIHRNRAGEVKETTKAQFEKAFGEDASEQVVAFWNDANISKKQWQAWIPSVIVTRALKSCKVITNAGELASVLNTYCPSVACTKAGTLTGEAIACANGKQSPASYYVRDGLKLANGGEVGKIGEDDVRFAYNAIASDVRESMIETILVPMAMAIGNLGNRKTTKKAIVDAIEDTQDSLLA